MGAPLILGLIGFSVITLGLGTMIMGIGASAGGTGHLKDIPWKKYAEHSYGFGLAAIPGAVVGFGIYVLSRVFMPFL